MQLIFQLRIFSLRLTIQSCFFFLALLYAQSVAAGGCPDCARQRDALAKIDWAAVEQVSRQRPEDLTSNEIAQIAAMSSARKINSHDYADALIVKWEGAMRVRLVDVNDNDIPLNKTPAKEISTHLSRLTNDIGLALSFTTRENKDNNVSVVILDQEYIWPNHADSGREAKSFFDLENTHTGAIGGVPELAGDMKTLGASYHSKKNALGRWHSMQYTLNNSRSEHQSFMSYYETNLTIKSCFMFLGDNAGLESESVDTAIVILDGYFAQCLGSQVSGLGKFWKSAPQALSESKASSELRKHTRYFLRLTQMQTKAGMKAVEAQELMAKHLTGNFR